MLRREEDVAARLISAATGVPWIRHDDGSAPGMYDYRSMSEPSAALEVVTLTNPATREDLSAFRWLRGLHGEDELQRHWILIAQPGHTTLRFKDIPARVVAALAVLEEGRVHRIEGSWAPGHLRCRHSAAAAEIATCLGGGQVSSRETSHVFPPGVEFALATSSSWPLDPDSVAHWIEKQLHGPDLSDVRHKLRRSRLPERNIFLWIDEMHGPWSMFRHWGTSEVPDAPMDVPDEVTGVWIGGYGSLLWSYSRALGWRAFEVDLEQPAGPWVEVTYSI